MNGRAFLLGAIYHIDGQFSHLPRFLSQFADPFNDLPYEHTIVLGAIEEICTTLGHSNDSVIADQQDALNILIAEDLMKVVQVLRNEEVVRNIVSEFRIEPALMACAEEATGLLRELGIESGIPTVRVVDQFPRPYHESQGTAMNMDFGDKQTYGIDMGVYFLRSGLRPFYSRFILLHELIHVVLGEKSPFLIARGLEEGLAEVLGSLYLSQKILGMELTRNLFVYNRLSYGHSQFWELYLDFARQATFLYRTYGLDGISALMNGGRELVKRVETQCLLMDFSQIALPCGRWDSQFSDLLNFCILTYGRNLVVSPLAKYVARFVKPGRSVVEILADARVEKTAGATALQELKERLACIYFRRDNIVVELTDCELLSLDSILRYEI